jgi:hypothetical protein
VSANVSAISLEIFFDIYLAFVDGKDRKISLALRR